MQEMWVPSLGREDPLKKEMATHSNILAWEIPRTEEPVRLQSMGLQKSCTLTSQLNNNNPNKTEGTLKTLGIHHFLLTETGIKIVCH